jgi:hypothetical protein
MQTQAAEPGTGRVEIALRHRDQHMIIGGGIVRSGFALLAQPPRRARAIAPVYRPFAGLVWLSTGGVVMHAREVTDLS